MMTMKQCGEVRKRRAVAAKTWVSTTKQCQGSWLGREVGEGKRCWHMEQSTVACSRSSTAILLTKISFFKLPSRTIPCKCAQNGNTKSCQFPKKAVSLYYLSHIKIIVRTTNVGLVELVSKCRTNCKRLPKKGCSHQTFFFHLQRKIYWN